MSLSVYEQKADLAPRFLPPWDRGLSVTRWGGQMAMSTAVRPVQNDPWLDLDLAVSPEAKDFHARLAEAIKTATEALRAFGWMDSKTVEDELPETFKLLPLSRRRATAKVMRRARARFYFVDSEGELEALD